MLNLQYLQYFSDSCLNTDCSKFLPILCLLIYILQSRLPDVELIIILHRQKLEANQSRFIASRLPVGRCHRLTTATRSGNSKAIWSWAQLCAAENVQISWLQITIANRLLASSMQIGVHPKIVRPAEQGDWQQETKATLPSDEWNRNREILHVL